MTVIALDVGDKTIGVAASDDLGITAQGVGTVQRRAERFDFPALFLMVADRDVSRWVVGWPLNMDGSEGPRALKTRRFAQRLMAQVPAPVLLWDERLSTWEADAVLREGRVRADRRKQYVDMLAAQLILQSYLAAGAPAEGVVP
jgi:putative Holliday junction resolvase